MQREKKGAKTSTCRGKPHIFFSLHMYCYFGFGMEMIKLGVVFLLLLPHDAFVKFFVIPDSVLVSGYDVYRVERKKV